MADTSLLRANTSEKLEIRQQEWAAKKWVWLVDSKEGCIATYVVKEAGDNVTVKLASGEERTVVKDDIEPQNPPKFDKCEDMSQLVHLNESSVLHNLRDRYLSNLIYTYSGLFLVVINPWRRLPIYTDEIVSMYKGKKRKDLPPHIFAVCDEAFREMVQNKESQSLLITGESGAGKTENTKKVIQYLASVAGTAGQSNKEIGQNQLEKQIIQTNPLLEAFGNAKTIRNNNSSRFGKFIRIEFGNDAKIVGCYIDNYLLEKSRVVRHAQNERAFHIFYQLLDGATADMKKDFLLEPPRFFKYLEGPTTIDGVDNATEFKDTLAAMTTIGFTQQEIDNVFRVVVGVLYFGNLVFTQSKRDESAQIADISVADKLSHVLGIKSPDFVKSILKPRVRTAKEMVTVSVTAQKAEFSCEALAKSIYERLFKWLVTKINQTLETHGRSSTFIGCLDIAGFEIFELNSFEQLCINLTNEKLQQFFNHHMFVQEQEEYIREGIDWKFVDFGMDLQPTIDLIEKPLGIMSILDEECLFPGATDKSFVEKLHAQHDGKSAKYGRLRLNPQMFTIEHYAGKVDYDTTNWLDKNKDPINDNVATLLANSSNELVAKIFADVLEQEQAEAAGTRGRQRASQFITVGLRHRQQLAALLTTLKNTQPHFVRCIIPNEQKKPSIIDAPLVLEQLRCNGVLEGIRIVRLGFPNRVPFAEFKQRYEMLASGVIPRGFMDSKVAAEKLVAALNVSKETFRIGISKVFFKSGVVADLEEKRDQKLAKIISAFQATAKGYLARKAYKRSHGKSDAILVIQRNALIYFDVYQWAWWKLFRQVKPLLGIFRQEQEERQVKAKMTELQRKLDAEMQERAALEAKTLTLEKERAKLLVELESEKDLVDENVQKLTMLEERRRQLQADREELDNRLEEAELLNEDLAKAKKTLTSKLEILTQQLEEEENARDEQLKKMREQEKVLSDLQKSLASEGNATSALMNEKKAADAKISQLNEELENVKKARAAADKSKQQTEAELARINQRLEDEANEKRELDKSRKKLEEELKKLRDASTVLHTENNQLVDSLAKRDAEIAKASSELAEVENKRSQTEKSLKAAKTELAAKDDELAAEKKARATLEAAKKKLEKDIEILRESLEDDSSKMQAVEEMRRAKEAELEDLKSKLSRDKEGLQANLEAERKRLKAEVAALQEQLEALQAQVTRLKRENETFQAEAEELSASLEASEKAKAAAEKNNRKLAADLKELQSQLSEEALVRKGLEEDKRSLLAQIESVNSRLNDGESTKSAVSQIKKTLEAELDDLTARLEEANKSKAAIERGKKALEAEIDELKDRVEEEEDARKQLDVQLAAAKKQLSEYDSKLQGDSLGKAKELEVSEKRLRSNLQEAEALLAEVQRNNEELEKAKAKLRGELDLLNVQLEDERRSSAELEKTKRKIEGDLKAALLKQAEDKRALELSERERKALRDQVDELEGTVEKSRSEAEALRRTKNSLESQLTALSEELGEGGRSRTDTVKTNKRLEATIDKMKAREAELEQLLSQLEDSKLRADRQIGDLRERLQREASAAQDQLESTKRELQLEIAQLNDKIEEEIQAKTAALSAKRELESQLADREGRLDGESKARSDLLKYRKKVEVQLRELQTELDQERSTKNRLTELLKRAEAKNVELAGSVEESQNEIDRQQRSRKAIEAEIDNLKEAALYNESARNQLLVSKRDLENEIRRLSDALEEANSRREDLEAQVRDHVNELDVTKKRLESEHQVKLHKVEEAKRIAERQIIELSARLDDKDKEMNVLLRSKDALSASLTELNIRLTEQSRQQQENFNERKRLSGELKDSQARLEQEKFSKAELERSLSKANAVIDQLKERINTSDAGRIAAERATTNLRSEMDQLEFQLAQEGREKLRLEAENREALVESDQLREKIEAQLEELNELRGFKRLQKDAMDALRTQLEGELLDKETELDKSRVRHNKEIQDLKQVLEDRNDRLAELRETNDSLEADLNQLNLLLEKQKRVADEYQQQVAKHQKRLSEVQKQLEDANNAEAEGDNRLRALGAELRTAKERYEHALTDLATSETRLATLKGEREEAEQRLSLAEGLKTTAEEKYSALLNEHAAITDALDVERDSKANLERGKSEVERLLEQTQQDLQKEIDISSALEKAKASLEHQVKELTTKLEDLELGKSAGSQRTVMRLDARIEELQGRLQIEAASRASAVKDKRVAERIATDAKLRTDELAKEKALFEDHIRKLESRVKSLRADIVATESRAADGTINTSKLERELLLEREKATLLQRENDRLRARLGINGKQDDELTTSVSSTKQPIRSVQREPAPVTRRVEEEKPKAVVAAPVAQQSDDHDNHDDHNNHDDHHDVEDDGAVVDDN